MSTLSALYSALEPPANLPYLSFELMRHYYYYVGLGYTLALAAERAQLTLGQSIPFKLASVADRYVSERTWSLAVIGRIAITAIIKAVG
ncbi:hypothetical protein SLS56_009948 [Neofusicoccum ribis]|uniref:Uncharacterized protein n=1 Tax=Neofusicoccum ribis TaxID=45134 RepID=A0ABR3SFV7_9PEZI